MSLPNREFYFEAPERIRTIAGDNFERFCSEAVQTYEGLFSTGWFMSEEPHYVNDEVINFMISLEDDKPGCAIVIPHLPRPILNWARVLVEEYVTRQCSWLAEGILADMCVNRQAYAQLWSSFGEYAVWERQCSCHQAQERWCRCKNSVASHEGLSTAVAHA